MGKFLQRYQKVTIKEFKFDKIGKRVLYRHIYTKNTNWFTDWNEGSYFTKLV